MFLQHRATALLRLLTLAMLMASFATALPAFAQTITVHRAGASVTDLTLGNHLWVSVSGARHNAAYTLRLADETGATVGMVTATTDATGNLAPTILWARSGVVGCDPGVIPNPLAYTFRTFEDAEALNGRTIQIVLTDIARSALVASMALPLVARVDQPRFYHADGAACPRFEMLATETVWIAGIHLPTGAPTSYTHWATASPINAATPLPYVDVRPSYPNGLVLNTSGASPSFTDLSYFSPVDHCIHSTFLPPVANTAGDGNNRRRFGPSATPTPTSTPTQNGSITAFPIKWCDPGSVPALGCPPCEPENP